MIRPGEEIIGNGNRRPAPRPPRCRQRFRVLEVVPVLDVVRFDEDDEPPFVGLLKVEAA